MSAPATGPKQKMLFQFEGEQLSVTQVHARVSALSPDTVRRYLHRGINTRQGMLTVQRRHSRGSKP